MTPAAGTESTGAPRPGRRIPADRMVELVAAGQARPLLPGYWPTPVWLDGQWWYNPLDSDDHDYIRASGLQAHSYDLMAAQLRRAYPDQPARDDTEVDTAPGETGR